MAGKRSKTYELMLEIAGRVDKSFGSSVGKAQKQLGGFSGTVKKVAGVVSAASIAMAGVNFLSDGVEQALAYESTMADVAKVVEGLRDKNGRLTESYYEMSDGILEMTTRIPMSAEEIGDIVAAAGQAGIGGSEEELLKFAEDAAKMSIAFDTTAEQAGEWMANWRTAFGMSQTEVVALADQINYLGNTTSENTQKLSGVVDRVGALGAATGVMPGYIAAMAASMTGVSEEISATGIKNLMLTMSAGSAATKTQMGVLDRLGYSAEELAERMQVDAQGAILDLLGAIKQLPAAEQSAVLTQYFGKESVAAIAPLLSNLPFLEEQFRKVADAEQYLGSMEEEYAARADTIANKIQLAQQCIDVLQMEIGGKLLPVIGWLAEKLTLGIIKMDEFFAAHEEALPILLTVVGSIASLVAAYKTMNFFAANGAAMAAGLSKAIGFIASPVGIAIVVIGALVAAGVLLYKNWDTIKAKAGELLQKVKTVFGGIKDAIVGAFTGARNKVASFFKWIDEKISSVPILGQVYGVQKNIAAKMFTPTITPTIPAMAAGGIVTAPTLSLIGEGGEPEAVMPLSRLESLLAGISTGDGGQVIFAPNIEVKGNADPGEVEAVVQLTFEKFKQYMEQYVREKRRLAY